MKTETAVISVVAIVLGLFILGNFGYGMMGYGCFGGLGMMGYRSGAAGIFGWLFMILVLVTLVLFIAWLVKQLTGNERRRK